jgi:hypothetical protein
MRRRAQLQLAIITCKLHAQVRKYFYPFLMRNDAPPPVPWERMPRHQFNDEAQAVSFPSTSLSLLILSLALIGLTKKSKLSSQIE